jgi:hypothetical protein
MSTSKLPTVPPERLFRATQRKDWTLAKPDGNGATNCAVLRVTTRRIEGLCGTQSRDRVDTEGSKNGVYLFVHFLLFLSFQSTVDISLC